MKRAARRRLATDDMGLSFLDVLSNGLGAAILLFIVLSALRNAGEILPGGEQFIRLTWTVADPQAMIQAWIRPPGTNDRRRLFFEITDSTSGSQTCVTPYAPGGVVMFGFTRQGADAAVSQDKGDQSRVFIVRIQSPMKGEWQVGALYFNRADALFGTPPDVEVKFDVQGSIEPILPKKVPLVFAREIVLERIVPTGESRTEIDDPYMARCEIN